MFPAMNQSWDPDTLYIPKDNSTPKIFGMILMGVSLLIVFTGNFRNANPQDFDSRIFYGTIIAGITGFLLMFIRSGIILNRREQTLTTVLGFFGFAMRTEHPWQAFRRVTVESEIRRGNKCSYTIFLAQLLNYETNQLITIEENTNYLTVKRVAKSVAQFMQIELVDSAGNTIVRQQPTEIGETVKKRITRTGKMPKLDELPMDSHIQQKREGNDLVLYLPPEAFGCRPLFSIILGGCLTLPVLIIALILFTGISTRPKAEINLIVILIFISTLLFFIGTAIHTLTTHFEVKVSSQRLQVTKISKFFRRSQEIPVHQLEQLCITNTQDDTLSPPRRYNTWRSNLFARESEDDNPIFSDVLKYDIILARSDHTTITFGHGLSKSELKWVLAVIENVIAAS